MFLPQLSKNPKKIPYQKLYSGMILILPHGELAPTEFDPVNSISSSPVTTLNGLKYKK